MPKQKQRRRWYPSRDCKSCGGAGFVCVRSYSRLSGRPMTAMQKCSCWYSINFGKPTKSRKKVFDGKAAAAGQ